MDADTDDEAEVLFRAKLQRQDASIPWGFRLQGGADFDKPLTLLKVLDGSLACKAGLQPGDKVFKLAGSPAGTMTHKDAQEAIRQSENSLEIIVGRREEMTISINKENNIGDKKIEAVEPTKNKDMGAVNNHDSSAADVQPMLNKAEVQSVNHAEIQSVNHAELQQVNHVEIQPVNHAEVQPVNQVEVQLVNHAEVQLVNHAEMQPVNHADVKQVNSESVAVVKPLQSSHNEVQVPEKNTENRESIPATAALPVLPPTVEVTPPSEPPFTSLRRQRIALQNNTPVGNIPLVQTNGSVSQTSTVGALSTAAIPAQQSKNSHLPLLPDPIRLASVSEEKLLTTADRRSGSNSPRNSPRLPSSPKQPLSPRSSPVLPWQQQIFEDRKFTTIPVIHERSSSDNALPYLTPESVPIHIQNEAIRVQNEAMRLQNDLGQRYSMSDLYPWRRPRSSSVDNSAGVGRTHQIPVFIAPHPRDIKITPVPIPEVAPPSDQVKHEPVKPSLKLVGKRIENTGYSRQDSDEAAAAFRDSAAASYQRSDYSTLGPEDIYFSAASPDLVDIPMPAVKEMVADLNRRLEAIAAQHPKLAEMSAPEFALTFDKKASISDNSCKDNSSSSSEEEMKEIFINSPPTDLDAIKARMLGLDNYEAVQKLYEASQFSPGAYGEYSPTSALKQPRRVHFADPPEQSVIEIEPRHRRQRRRNTYDATPMASSTPNSFVSPDSSGPAASSYFSQPSSMSAPTAGLYSQSELDSSYPSMEMYPPSSSSYESYQQPSTNPSHVNITVTHRHGEQAGKQYTFSMPSAQPGQPTRFHYTISGRKPTDPFSLSYSIPPSYEESMRNRGQMRSRDDSFIPTSPYRYATNITNASPTPYHRSPTPDFQQMRPYSPSASPTRMTSPTGRGSPQTIQSRSFKVLEATLADQPGSSGGKAGELGPVPGAMRVEVLGHPRQVLQPVAISRPFVPTSSSPVSSPEFTPPPSRSGSSLGPPARNTSQLAFPFPPSHPLAALGIPPGVIALFDKDFTDRFLQWQNQRRSHFESETYKLVREMDNNKKFGQQ